MEDDVEDDDVTEDEDEDDNAEDEVTHYKVEVEDDDVEREENSDVEDVEDDNEKDDNIAEDEAEDDDVAEDEVGDDGFAEYEVEDGHVEDDDGKGEENDDVEDDYVQKAEEDRSQDRDAQCVRACPVEMHLDMSEEFSSCGNYKQNPAAQENPDQAPALNLSVRTSQYGYAVGNILYILDS